MVKLESKDDLPQLMEICKKWEVRTRMTLGYEYYKKVVQRDVNNYIVVEQDGGVKRKGAVVKKLKSIDNDLPIVNRAVVDYFVDGIPVEHTVMASDNMIDFQKVTKISSKYGHGKHNGKKLSEKVFRCFASKSVDDGTLFKFHKLKRTYAKTPSTPVNCFIYNDNVVGMKVLDKVDRKWYIDLANDRIKKFLGEK